jgi:hypothetical protein
MTSLLPMKSAFIQAIAIVFAALWVCSTGVVAQTQNDLTEEERQELEAQESPWPDWINVYSFPEAPDICVFQFTKFSIRENGSYICEHTTFSNLKSTSQLPPLGAIKDLQSERTVSYSLQQGDLSHFLSAYGTSAEVVRQQLNARGGAPAFVPAASPQTKPFPVELRDFMENLGRKWNTDGLEIHEMIYEPPVWRQVPLKQEIKRMSVEQWNQKVEETESK